MLQSGTTSKLHRSATMEPLRPESLTPELQDRIASFVPRPSDLKALCLSCKQLNAIATPHLYRLVVIDPSAAHTNAGFLSMGNPGHCHIKSLRFTPLQDKDRIEQHIDANQVIRLTLYCLPKDSLLCLKVPKALRMEFETLAAIFTQQRAIRELVLGPIRDAASRPSLRIRPTLGDLRSVTMHFLGDERDLAFYNDIMVHIHDKIRHLSLSGSTRYHSATGQPLPLNNTESQAGMLITTVFRSPHGTLSSMPLQLSGLQSLRAWKLSFINPASTWSRVIPFGQLSSLMIDHCTGLEEFFLWLGLHFRIHASHLKDFACRDHNVPYSALEHVLKSFTGLESCEVTEKSSRTTQRLEFTSLATHYNTLKRLKLIGASADGLVSRQLLDAFDIVEMVTHCQQLEEIYLAFPTISIASLQGQNWAAYGKWLDFLARLPRLEILHIATWPIAPFPDNSTPLHMYKTAYHNLMSQCALAVQSRIDQHRPSQSLQLKLLTFGNAPSRADRAMTNDGGDIAMSRLYFVRQPAPLRSGDGLPSMISVPARLVRYCSNYTCVRRESGNDHGSMWYGYNAMSNCA